MVYEPKEASLKNLGASDTVGKPMFIKTKTENGWVPYDPKEHKVFVDKGLLTVLSDGNGVKSWETPTAGGSRGTLTLW